ncbi:MAG: hypothetical protein MZU95_10980 [Desulfomicrobium escambiense]|nr:hypothetical protein [Desulfomicrobium escambiense]
MRRFAASRFKSAGLDEVQVLSTERSTQCFVASNRDVRGGRLQGQRGLEAPRPAGRATVTTIAADFMTNVGFLAGRLDRAAPRSTGGSRMRWRKSGKISFRTSRRCSAGAAGYG